MTVEKRELARAPMDTSVHFTVDGRQWRESRSKDISPTGLFILSNTPVEPGQVVGVKFQIPNLKYADPIKTQAEVMRRMVRKGHQSGFGLRFLTLTKTQYQLVTDFVGRVLGVPLTGDPRSSSPSEASIFDLDRLARQTAAETAPDPPSVPMVPAYDGVNPWPWVRRALLLGGSIAFAFLCYYLMTQVLNLVMKFSRIS